MFKRLALTTAAPALTKDAIFKAIKDGHGRSLGGTYRTKDGRTFYGQAVSNVGSNISGAGFKGYSRIDKYDLKELGCEVVEAETMRGDKGAGRFVDTLVIEWNKA